MDIKTLCLGILTLGEASGYELKKHFEDGPISQFHHAGFGSIYPALGKLHDEGLVTRSEMVQDGRPDKKVYAITSRGLETFRQALAKPPTADKIRSECLLILFFEHLLEAGHSRHVFEEYLASYHRLLACVEARDMSEMPPGRRFVHGFGMTIYRAIIAYMEDNRGLLLDAAEASDTTLKTGTGR